ncbi:arsenate reductase ArsC [Thermosulfurimonas marina]|uniref:Arsenate reductase ArsC n=1 Tax=Thermosulfurimonas marina TaxID=2047767 RepID=A0A6H1WTL4_9BACT|nr:arsenate reductase ArsC [Thermosulfurimonas marina]QJA06520.1 arsenate reductase ArsC [Thermosulfurimonas marina]
MAKRVLFVCTENACRSQMAEALANHFFRDRVRAFSAGVRPKEVHPLAREVLSELGIETSGLRSKHLDEFSGEEFDLVVTLCDSAAAECPYFPGARRRIHLPFPDPSREGTPEAFRRVRDLILAELRKLFEKEGHYGGT